MFSCGVVTDRPADLVEDDAIRFTNTYPGDYLNGTFPQETDGGGNPVTPGLRIPDAIAFSPDGSAIYTANEGEMNSTGGRGVSAFDVNGNLLWDDNGLLERLAVVIGQYPDGRSENKGVEMEGVTTGVFGGREYAFFLSERGSFMAIFDISNPASPVLNNLLPTGISPEGVKAIGNRGLV